MTDSSCHCGNRRDTIRTLSRELCGNDEHAAVLDTIHFMVEHDRLSEDEARDARDHEELLRTVDRIEREGDQLIVGGPLRATLGEMWHRGLITATEVLAAEIQPSVRVPLNLLAELIAAVELHGSAVATDEIAGSPGELQERALAHSDSLLLKLGLTEDQVTEVNELAGRNLNVLQTSLRGAHPQ